MFTEPPPPWEDEIVVDTRPTPQNQGKNEVKRRNHTASKHLDEVLALLEDDENAIIYTDATKDESGTAIAYYCANTHERFADTLCSETNVKEAELQAIEKAIVEFKKVKLKRRLYIYTDCKEAVQECSKHDSRSKTVRTIKTTAKQLRVEGYDIKIRWIPGHQSIQGNDEAHAAAREQLQASLPGRGSTRPVDRKDTIEETDPAELKAQEREERRRRLNEQLQQDEHPLPSTSYSRWERVCLRRLRTGTAMTPARINKFKRKDNEEDPQAGLCEECLVPADTQHIFWDCPSSAEERKNALESLSQPVRPSCLQEWILPVGCPEHRKAILDSLIDYIKSAGLVHCI